MLDPFDRTVVRRWVDKNAASIGFGLSDVIVLCSMHLVSVIVDHPYEVNNILLFVVTYVQVVHPCFNSYFRRYGIKDPQWLLNNRSFRYRGYHT